MLGLSVALLISSIDPVVFKPNDVSKYITIHNDRLSTPLVVGVTLGNLFTSLSKMELSGTQWPNLNTTMYDGCHFVLRPSGRENLWWAIVIYDFSRDQ